jgi:hypothetical protein
MAARIIDRGVGLQNEAGVILHLKAKQTGLRLSLGGDAVVISMRR